MEPANVHEEQQYLNLIADILANGNVRLDRTGVGTISKFAVQMRFNLHDGRFPLLTTKRVNFKAVAEELLWFIRGDTYGKNLEAVGVNIWKQNGTKDFLEARGLPYEEDDLGPVYGFQWRHFGAEYINHHTDYTGQGKDQLAEVIRLIKEDPYSRRIILSAWNPAQVDKMALPPCHMFCQFYVTFPETGKVCFPETGNKGGYLSCVLYQRSGDMGLGVPFNIASYSLLTYMIATECDLLPGEFIHMIGDAHVYSTHIDALKIQLTRSPRQFPRIVMPKKKVIEYVYEDFTILDYKPHGVIKMPMAV